VGWLIYSGCYFIITAVSNGANLTDGIDGLMAEPAISVLAFRARFFAMDAYLACVARQRKSNILWYGPCQAVRQAQRQWAF
jgi:UDP-N-acetylmuramyl pentapeptide phosphotransferase/UDP-N-acetylglucosamine-1-phosphate transferase